MEAFDMGTPAKLAELRAILAPLLDEPYVFDDDGAYGECRWCQARYAQQRMWSGHTDKLGRKINTDVDTTPHASDCPVLRKDELLGRLTMADLQAARKHSFGG